MQIFCLKYTKNRGFIMIPHPGKLFIISAPSGGGKTTITEEVITRLGQLYDIQKVITYTSRAPRNNEVNGIDYYFVTPEDFIEKKSHRFFLETTSYDNNYYGSPASIISDLDHGKSFILVTDRQGALILKNKVPGAVLIWVYVTNPLEIKNRLINRSKTQDQIQDSPKNLDQENLETNLERNKKLIHTIERRFILAQQEIKQELHENFFRYHIANDILEEAVQKVCTIIQNELG
jgi:guanylate kinase